MFRIQWQRRQGRPQFSLSTFTSFEAAKLRIDIMKKTFPHNFYTIVPIGFPELIEKELSIDDGTYSRLRIMHSNAGYYIGRTYRNNFDECEVPGSRESDYFPTSDAAEKALAEGFAWRASPENIFLYERHRKAHS